MLRISEIIRNFSIFIFFITLSYATIECVNLLRDTQKVAKESIVTINNQVDLLRIDLFNSVDKNFSKLDNRIFSIEKNLFARVDSIESNTFNSVSRMNQNLDILTKESVSLSSEYRQIPKEINKSLFVLNNRLDCKYNDFCWPNLVTDVLIDSRNMVRTGSNSFLLVNKEIPKITKEVTKVSTSLSDGIPIIVSNTSRVTANIDRLTKPRWYDRILGVGANASLIYFNVSKVR